MSHAFSWVEIPRAVDFYPTVLDTDEHTTDSGETIPTTRSLGSNQPVGRSSSHRIPDTGGHYALITDSETNRIGLMSAE